MTTTNCENVRDIYPDILHGAVDAATSARVRAHIASCDECAAECALLDALYAQPVVVPSGLEARVSQAVKRVKPMRWYIGRGQLAMAATLAFALIGGSAILQMQQREEVQSPAPTTVAPAPHIGAVGVEDAMLSGKSSLDDLSVEQLKKLLGEIQS